MCAGGGEAGVPQLTRGGHRDVRPIVVPSQWSRSIGILAMATDNERRVRGAEGIYGPIARRWIGTLRPLALRAQATQPLVRPAPYTLNRNSTTSPQIATSDCTGFATAAEKPPRARPHHAQPYDSVGIDGPDDGESKAGADHEHRTTHRHGQREMHASEKPAD